MLTATTRNIVLIFGIFAAVTMMLNYGGIMGTSETSFATTTGQSVPEASPVDSTDDGGASQRVPVSADGHFYVDAVVGSTALRFLVDTGASSVAITRSDAAHLGVVLDEDDFTGWATTASGDTRFAPVVLDSVRIDGNWMYDVDAVVIDADATHSLLGMSYLRRLKGFEVSARALTLRWE